MVFGSQGGESAEVVVRKNSHVKNIQYYWLFDRLRFPVDQDQ
jgi:hypothetical protein